MESVINPSSSWTNDPAQVSANTTWYGTAGYGVMLKEIFDLRDSRPIMCSTRGRGGSTFLFESQGQYYIWDELSHVVLHISEPKTVPGIVDAIRKGGTQDLSTQIIEPIKNREDGGPLSYNEMMISQ